MAKVCPLSGCKEHSVCIHDKMMIGMGVPMMFFVVAHWGIHLF